MKRRIEIDNELALVPYYKDYETSFKWYLDKDVCKQCDNLDHVYDLDRLDRMYTYLDENGDLYYIEYNGVLVGDACLQNNGDIGIVVSKEYQNKHIGRRVIKTIIDLARKKEYPYVHAEIYSFNKQSEVMFLKCGFVKESEEQYYYRFDFDNLIDNYVKYAKFNSMIEASLLVGSYARGEQKADSDVDIVIITNSKQEMLTNEFFVRFGNVITYKTEYYGACTSLRVYYSSGLEVEFGIVEPSWMNKPLDEGTNKVLSDGYKILIDKKDYFKDLVLAN